MFYHSCGQYDVTSFIANILSSNPGSQEFRSQSISMGISLVQGAEMMKTMMTLILLLVMRRCGLSAVWACVMHILYNIIIVVRMMERLRG